MPGCIDGRGEKGEFADALTRVRVFDRPVIVVTGDAGSSHVRAAADDGWEVRRIERLPDISGATYLLLPR